MIENLYKAILESTRRIRQKRGWSSPFAMFSRLDQRKHWAKIYLYPKATELHAVKEWIKTELQRGADRPMEEDRYAIKSLFWSAVLFLSVSEVLFCGGKPDGNYQDPTTCQAYIACSYGVTSHVECPAGKKFDTVKRICEPAERATCTVVSPSKKSKSSRKWRIIATLKRGLPFYKTT